MNLLRYFLEEFPYFSSAVMTVKCYVVTMTEFIGLVSGKFVLLWGQFKFEKNIVEFPEQSNYSKILHKDVKHREFSTVICAPLHNPDI